MFSQFGTHLFGYLLRLAVAHWAWVRVGVGFGNFEGDANHQKWVVAGGFGALENVF